MLKQQTKIRNTYWLEHKIIMNIDNNKEYLVIRDHKQSKQKNILKRYGSLEKFYQNV